MALPWELAFEEEYIGLRPRLSIVRYLDLPDPPVPVTVQPPLRLFMAVSQPEDTSPLKVDRELASIREALAQLAGQVEVDVFDPTTVEELLVCVLRVRPSEYPVFVVVKGKETFYIRAGNASQPLSISQASRYIGRRFENT